ncbi:radical SAM protein [Streptococcus suis]|uniref:radical SAM protein n=1 Tax=Streptococcus suis TaxID=1307 RepID=UPI00192D1F95|nr:radical SAM protein [Streptococcus suis]MBL6440924.1 radical SAM protein [Streptococcus suis]
MILYIEIKVTILIEKKLILCIANKCFVKCPGCYHIFPKSPEEITNIKMVNFLDSAIENGLTKVTFAGGDPLTRQDIPELIEFCYNKQMKINIDTVGTPLLKSCSTYDRQKDIEQIIDFTFLSKVNYVGIPLDGSSNETIQLFRRGRKNFLEEQLDILSILEKLDVNVCINTVLHKGNIDDIDNIFELISMFKNVKKWQIFEFMPIGDLGFIHKERYQIINMDKTRIQNLLNLETDIEIEYKSSLERENSYMFINSIGEAYKIDIDNNVQVFGNVNDESSWEQIFSNM